MIMIIYMLIENSVQWCPKLNNLKVRKNDFKHILLICLLITD